MAYRIGAKMGPNAEDLEKLKLLFATGQLSKLKTEIRSALEKYPSSAILYNMEGAVEASNGDSKKAIASYSKAIQLRPDYHKAMDNCGKLYFENGQFEKALELFQRSILIHPENENALLGLALISAQENRLSDAINYYLRIIKLSPSHERALHDIGAIYLIEGDYDTATRYLGKLYNISSKSISGLVNYATALSAMGQIDRAINLYHEAVEMGAEVEECCYSICVSLERTNQLTQLASFLTKECVDQFKGCSHWHLSFAALKYREGDFKGGIFLLKKVNLEDLSMTRQRTFHSIFGRCAIELNLSDLAMTNFECMNSIAQKQDKQRYLDRSRRLKLVHESSKSWAKIPFGSGFLQNQLSDKDKPIFMVGFPRSGTTLLDTFLRGFNDVEVFEEKPFVSGLMEEALALNLLPARRPLSAIKGEHLRKKYWSILQKGVNERPLSRFVIDKLPLNLAHVPILHHVFERPKFIVSLRHPLDCILSCYFQDFESNAAMIRTTDLKDTAVFYAETMGAWLECKKTMDLNFVYVRYEDLILNKDLELIKVAEFLGVKQDVESLDNVDLALQRNIVNTPSYRQISQPIYRNAINRWKSYKKHLGDCVEIIAPIAHELGYDI
jgi:tetratricopeptide (TPR) repeat protein